VIQPKQEDCLISTFKVSKKHLEFLILIYSSASKVISNRPGVVANPTVGGDGGSINVGVYGSNSNLVNGS
jgi:hypothetical protein